MFFKVINTIGQNWGVFPLLFALNNLENFKELQNLFNDCCGNESPTPSPAPSEEKKLTLPSKLEGGIT